MPFAKLRDLDVYYERNGEGPPVLFISGSGGDLRATPKQVFAPITSVFDTVAYDQRGLGQTSKPDAPYSMADYADDAAALLDFLEWDRVPVIGISFGGMVAQELMLRHPTRVSRAVLGCTSPGGAGGASYPFHDLQDMTADERARHLVPIRDTRCDAVWQKDHPEQTAALIAMASADPYAAEPGRAMGARRQLEARAALDTWDRLPGIACPVLIAAGAYDGIALQQTQRKMAAQIPGALLRFFEGGHLFFLQDRSAFPAMVEFLKG